MHLLNRSACGVGIPMLISKHFIIIAPIQKFYFNSTWHEKYKRELKWQVLGFFFSPLHFLVLFFSVTWSIVISCSIFSNNLVNKIIVLFLQLIIIHSTRSIFNNSLCMRSPDFLMNFDDWFSRWARMFSYRLNTGINQKI